MMFPDFCYLNFCLHFRTKHMRLFRYIYSYSSYFCLFIICWLEGHPIVINDPAFPAVTSSKFIPLAVAKLPCDKTIKSFDTTPQLGDVQTLFSLLDVFFSFFMYGFIYFSLFLNEIWMCLLSPWTSVTQANSPFSDARQKTLLLLHQISNTIFYIEILLFF